MFSLIFFVLKLLFFIRFENCQKKTEKNRKKIKIILFFVSVSLFGRKVPLQNIKRFYFETKYLFFLTSDNELEEKSMI